MKKKEKEFQDIKLKKKGKILKQNQSIQRTVLMTSIKTILFVGICLISFIVFLVLDNYFFSENENNDVYNFNQNDEFEFYQNDDFLIPATQGLRVSKPNIYLYPEEQIDVRVELDFAGDIFADYPKYDEKIGGWDVVAAPDGTLINKADNKEYSYLFWEGDIADIDWDMDKGFVVPGNETREFLQEILPKIGLSPKEYNEFIVYWYPLMQENPYNLIHFAQEQYTDIAHLSTIPAYDSLLRVFMVAKPLQEFIDIEKQEFSYFERNGFTVVEWGGAIIQ